MITLECPSDKFITPAAKSEKPGDARFCISAISPQVIFKICCPKNLFSSLIFGTSFLKLYK